MDLFTAIAILVIFYINYEVVFGTGIAWFIYSFNADKYKLPEELTNIDKSNEVTNKDLWIDYLYGTNIVSIKSTSTMIDFTIGLLEILISVVIGYWIGWIHGLIHSWEIKEAKKKLKLKYKKQ